MNQSSGISDTFWLMSDDDQEIELNAAPCCWCVTVSLTKFKLANYCVMWPDAGTRWHDFIDPANVNPLYKVHLLRWFFLHDAVWSISLLAFNSRSDCRHARSLLFLMRGTMFDDCVPRCIQKPIMFFVEIVLTTVCFLPARCTCMCHSFVIRKIHWSLALGHLLPLTRVGTNIQPD